jgi:CDP-diacylglycerol---glycerol-3-phosphate 3-phosphatidyltransferase
LITVLDEALRDNPELEVSILTDALRGTRESPEPSCASLLAPLIVRHGDRVKISLFHTPNLTGWRKKYLPRRINEGWGLQHMKLYGFDDEIMLSGCEILCATFDAYGALTFCRRANLSDDYFTNRVDRYHIFSSKELTQYYYRIHDAVCDLSYHLQPSNDAPLRRGLPDPVWHSKRFKAHAKSVLEPLIHKTARQSMFPVKFSDDKTFVYPVAQFDILLGEARNKSFGNYEFASYTSTEKPSLIKLLKNLAENPDLRNCNWTFTAGYFNIDPEISSLLVESAPAPETAKPSTPLSEHAPSAPPCTVITASPWANGFYGSAGISGMLPAAYTLLSRRFLRNVAAGGRESSIQLKEWRRGTVGEPGGWTYHAKGLWVTLPAASSPSSSTRNLGGESLEPPAGPSITLIGSSNYTKRSYSLDLEIGALVVTSDRELQRKFREETEWLQQNAVVVTKDDLMKIDRRVGFKVRFAMWLVEKLGGAL